MKHPRNHPFFCGASFGGPFFGGLLLVVLLLGSLTGREGLRGVEICNETELMHQDRMKSAACKATIPKTGGNAEGAKTFLFFLNSGPCWRWYKHLKQFPRAALGWGVVTGGCQSCSSITSVRLSHMQVTPSGKPNGIWVHGCG